MKKKLLALVIAVLAFAPIASVATPVQEVSAACAGSSITVYPDANGGGVSKTFCAPNNVANLASIGSTSCLPFPSWNDCISSVTVKLVAGSSSGVCLWTDKDFTGNGLRFINSITKYNLGSTWNDKVSSIEWGYNCF